LRSVVLSELAEADLTNIFAYVAQDNPEAADRVIGQIYEKCQFLAQSPKAGRKRIELHASIRSFGVGSYVIFYRESRGGIEVARVLHGRRDIPTVFNP
jgi:toxin ParE1/3/4